MKKFAALLLTISGLLAITPGAFAINACALFSNATNTQDPYYYDFQGNNGTLNNLGGLALSVGPDQNNPSSVSGDLEYYGGSFGSNVAGTCTDNKNDTASVYLAATADPQIGWIKGIFYVTPAGPVFHVTSSSLLNQNNLYSNVTGDLTLTSEMKR